MLIPSRTTPISPTKRVQLEQYLRANVRQTALRPPTTPRRTPGSIIPLSFAQEQVWLHAQMAPELPLYNEPVTIHYNGVLDVVALNRAFNEILRRHEAWRTSFAVVDGRPVQHVEPELTIDIPRIDLRRMPVDRREAEAKRIATRDAARPLDLAQAPLFRARLIRLEDTKYRLYLTLCHIIFDGVAFYRVFLPELAALYKAYAAGLNSPLPELDFQYPDFACWQRGEDQAQKISNDLQYWRKQLAGDLPTLDLPVDRPRPAVQSFRGSMYPFVLSASLLRKLKALSASEGVTLFQVLLAAFAALLHRYSQQDDIPIGSVTSGRNYPGTNAMLGYFLNTVVLRLDLSGQPTFRSLVKRARNTTLEALAHDSVPFGTLLNDLRVPRNRSHNPLFQSLFTLDPPLPDLDPCWQLTQMDIDTGATKYDIYLELDERTDCVLARYHYSTDLFTPSTIARMAEEWLTLVESAVDNPDKRLHELSILTERNRQQMLSEWNATELEFPGCTVHELIEAQVCRTPDAVAVECEGTTLTYDELNVSANKVARHLTKLGARPDTLIAICMERSAELIVGLLAILKSGAGYVPLDPTCPESRLRHVISDSRPLAILTQPSMQNRFRDQSQVVAIDSNWPFIAPYDEDNLETTATGRDVAYVIYTCGPTGAPKGVQIEHRSLVNFLTSMSRQPGMSSSDVLVGVTPIACDIAALEIFLPLMVGARLVVAPSETTRDVKRLAELLERRKATVMQATPTTWRMLLESGWRGSKTLKALAGGEALTAHLADSISEQTCSFWNLYGLTECTVWSTVQPIVGQEPISVGRPISNTTTYILDTHGNPVPIGVAGELHIGGAGVARGYLNQPELTGQRFIDNPFGAAGTHLYKTGDIARYKSDGRIEFLGRADTQVDQLSSRRDPHVVAPRNEIEARLTTIWEDVLGSTPRGVTDDFFELGGHSLLAVRLFAEIEKLFGKSIPLAVLLQASTIEQLARILSKDGKMSSWASLVPIQRQGTLPPLFCVHGHYGEILFYRPLSQRLGDGQPFYALQARALSGKDPPHATIEAMAAHYISEIRQAQPHGPYQIAGYCLGSLIAFEIAQQLIAAGEDIAFLGLFMGYEPRKYSLSRLRKRMDRHIAQLRRDGFRAKRRDLLANGRLRLKSLIWRLSYRALRPLLRPSSHLFGNVPEMNLQAARRYQARLFPGTMTVFLSGEVPAGFRLDPKRDLNGLDARHIEVRTVPGERDTMMMEPYVTVLSEELKASLNHALKGFMAASKVHSKS